MATFTKHDIKNTLLIIWFIVITGYVFYGLYAGYKGGIVQATQGGYSDSIMQLMGNVAQGKCQPIEIRKDDKKVSVVDVECLKQQGDQAQNAQQSPAAGAKK